MHPALSFELAKLRTREIAREAALRRIHTRRRRLPPRAAR